MRARTALALLCTAHACTATALALTLPCRFFEYRATGTGCVPCTAHTFGTFAHCARYNETLPWANATSEFERLQLAAFAHECERYADANTNSSAPGEAVAHQCDHLGADGALAGTVVLAPGGITRTEYTSPLEPAVRIPCQQGSYRVNATSCLRCPNNTTTNGGNKTSVFDCEWCELGFHWQPQTRTCLPCPECYTTRPDPQPMHAGADYTRAEHCSPCSVWADDYRRGGCDATVAGQCVLHVPYADVHAVHMQAARDEYNESWRGVFCSYEVWRKAADVDQGSNAKIDDCKNKRLVPASPGACTQVDMYVYKAETQRVHALFRPQSRAHLFNGSQAYARASAAYAEMPPGVRDFTYTTGTAFPGPFEDLWQSHFADKGSYDYRAETDVVPPPFQLSGSYAYPMHPVSVDVAPYYDFARAYHEHWLLGMLSPSQQACTPGNLNAYQSCAQYRLQQYGILLCGDDVHEEKGDIGYGLNLDQCKQESMCDVLGVSCTRVFNDEPFCNAYGKSAEVWRALDFYLYNATKQYADMEQNVKVWEDSMSNRTQSEAAESAACDRTHVDLSVLVANTGSSAQAILYEIRARDLGDNQTLYELALERALEPPLLAFQHNFTVEVPVGSSIQVEVLASNDARLHVQVWHAGVHLNSTSTPSTYDAQDEYTVCLQDTDEDLVQVKTPADFSNMHTFLRAQLCDYA